MSSPGVEFGFVAALEREVVGIVRGWRREEMRPSGAPRVFYRHADATLVCAGTGAARAYAAAKMLVEKSSPKMLLSIGFAGSCVNALQPGSVLIPEQVLEAASGRTFRCAFGSGGLVTVDGVAGKGMKQQAASRWGAQALDMEAAGVARAAAECGCEFAAIKAISDGVDEEMDFVSAFVTPEGFSTGRFLAHVALRPGLWPRVAALQRNSKLATAALAGAVAECMSHVGESCRG